MSDEAGQAAEAATGSGGRGPGLGSFSGLDRNARPQAEYDRVKQKFAEERDLRLAYRPEGRAQYTTEVGRYESDPHASEVPLAK